MEIVKHHWPKTKQPEKKVQTILVHLKKLKQSGYCMQVGENLFCGTKAGIKAFHESTVETQEGYHFQPIRRPLLHLYKG